MARLEAKGVSVSFERSRRMVQALQDVSLEIDHGKFVSIVGPSGCGKTTFLRLVAGVLRDYSGEILLDGQAIRGPARDRAMVFQQDGLLPWRSVMDNVTIGLQIAGMGREERNRIGKQFIDLVGLAGFEQSFPHELSGGMRQRVNLSRALAIDPVLLLMDEPFASLDAQTREIMQSELLKIWSETTRTVLFITHQIDEALYLSEQVVVMTSRPGRVLEVIDVDLPRPRALQVKRSPEFVALVDRVWHLLESEVRRAMLVS